MSIVKKYRYWILAIVFSIPMFIYGLNDSSSVLYITIAFGFLFGCGLILGLIPFKRLKYLDRVNFIIPISIILLGICMTVAIAKYEYGIFEPYNYFAAKQDIRSNKIQIISYGLVRNDFTIRRKLANKFGFKIVNQGCIVNGNGYRHYNSVMKNYLKAKNGDDWEKRFHIIADSAEVLFNSATNSLPSCDIDKLNLISDSILNKFLIK